VRLLRPEWGLLPHAIPRPLVARQFWSLFHDREAIDEALADVVVDGFRKIYANPAGRHAFLASARNIYLDPPWGRNGFYPRLGELAAPTLFVWGSHDWLIPAAFRHVVDEWLPTARQIVLPGCGHVPQVEQPDAVNPLLLRFFDEAGSPRRRGRGRRRSAA
jgi:pimeloyl-ACP methyl ester carboxylesterase